MRTSEAKEEGIDGFTSFMHIRYRSSPDWGLENEGFIHTASANQCAAEGVPGAIMGLWLATGGLAFASYACASEKMENEEMLPPRVLAIELAKRRQLTTAIRAGVLAYFSSRKTSSWLSPKKEKNRKQRRESARFFYLIETRNAFTKTGSYSCQTEFKI